MKQIGIFDRIAMLEAQTARLAQIMAAQVDALQSLTDQITALQTALDAPRAVAIMPMPNPVPMSSALRSMMQISADVAASSNLTVADLYTNFNLAQGAPCASQMQMFVSQQRGAC